MRTWVCKPVHKSENSDALRQAMTEGHRDTGGTPKGPEQQVWGWWKLCPGAESPGVWEGSAQGGPGPAQTPAGGLCSV